MSDLASTLAVSSPDSRIAVINLHPAALAAGTVLGGVYRLERCLGRGGMGDIHVATQEKEPGEVVVKVLNPDLSVNDEAIVRFRQEATVMAKINHPNVVRLLDFNLMQDGRPYLVMEYLPGQNLGDLLATKTFTVAEVSSIIHQVACALDAAHQLGIVHRDLKPENIMVVPRLGQRDLIKVIDFGICKARRLNHLTSKGMVMGTPEFMSPEQAQGRHEEVEAPSDQFALAIITYLMLAGRMPWVATTPEAFLHCVVHKYPLALTDDGKCRPIEVVLFRAMAKAPDERYPSILAFAEALDLALVEAGLLLAPVVRVSVPAPLPSPAPLPAPLQLRNPVPAVRRTQAEIVTEPLETLERQRKRGTHVGWAAVSLATLMLGGYLASVGAPTIRARATGAWNELRGFAADSAARHAVDGQRWISRASQNAKAYLSMGSSP
jgi:serine/threonine protein kinase